MAVKIQYAGLESAVAADLATFSGLAAIAGTAFPDFKLGWVRAPHLLLCRQRAGSSEAKLISHAA